MTSPARLQELIGKQLQDLNFQAEPTTLYEPIRYMLALGGKRMRPVLLLMGTELFGGNIDAGISAATGIEVFHNFTLLHDDIMDNAPLRRTKQTVHNKWNANIAILSGDAMFVKSCELMMQVPNTALRDVLDIFHKTALEVCEGQQFDMDFEKESIVTIDSYLNMIRLKTAVLLGCSLKIGALIANASKEDAQHLYDFGVNLGLAFQLQDDVLDVYANAEKFGKQVGGDILSNKKTYLLLTALNQSTGVIKEELLQWIYQPISDDHSAAKVEAVTRIYNSLGVREQAQQRMELFYKDAFLHLSKILIDSSKKEPLRLLAESLLVREV